jgi:threonine dehydrogenase-like Zn-dependent dehydrogenase
MSTMPQLTLTAPGSALWTDVEVPALDGDDGLGATAALVRPVAVATCDLDTWVNAGTFPLPLPYALGHEFVAEVVSTGSAVDSVVPGDLVAVPFQVNCGQCARCRRGLTHACTAVPRGAAYGLGEIGGTRWGGAVTELVRVPFADAMLLAVPPGVSPATVASLDNLPDGWRTVGPYLTGEFADDRRVLVVGGLSIGLYAVAIARALGADVTYVEPTADARRTAIAAALGATIGSLTDRLGRFPVTVNTSGGAEGLVAALRATEAGGVCTDTGIHLTDVPLPLFAMYSTGLRFVTGRVAARHDLPSVLSLVAEGCLDPGVVTATVADWSDAPAAWSAHRDKLVLVR